MYSKPLVFIKFLFKIIFFKLNHPALSISFRPSQLILFFYSNNYYNVGHCRPALINDWIPSFYMKYMLKLSLFIDQFIVYANVAAPFGPILS